MGGSTDAFSTLKTHLTEVKEEPQEPDTALIEEDNYFRTCSRNLIISYSIFRTNADPLGHFNDFHAADQLEGRTSTSIEYHEYDLSDHLARVPNSPEKRKAENTPFRGITRISTRLSSMSSKWKQKQLSDTAAALERYDESLRSRANSATSTLVSPAVSSISRRQSINSPSSARTAFEERLNEAGVAPLDIDKANKLSGPEPERHATTPLLPPMMVDLPNPDGDMALNSPLQSPTIAHTSMATTNSSPASTSMALNKIGVLPTPPISAQPSLSSISRHQGPPRPANADVMLPSPVSMDAPTDEWSHKLGHANFTIVPEPYIPAICNGETLKEHRASWETARCNLAKHLVRTGEHYGVTSNIYKVTEEKCEAINNQWRKTHNHVASNLADRHRHDNTSILSGPLHLRDVQTIKIPRLHDKEKFPDLGDEDIVGPMSVDPHPTPLGQDKPRKRPFLKFFHDIFC
jgi:hypothetical protein